MKRGTGQFLLYSNVMVGGIAVCFVLGSYALLDLPVSPPLLVLAFCATFLVYQFERALWPAPEDVINQPERVAWVRRHRRYVWLSSIAAGVVALGSLVYLRPATLGVGMGLAVLGLSYVLPVLPGRRRLKAVWFMKPLAIAGAWAAGGVALPVIESGDSLSVGVMVFMGYRLFFVLPNALLTDLPDRAGDAVAGLITPALRFSVGQIRSISLLALACAGVCAVLAASLLELGWLLLVDLAGIGWMARAVWRVPDGSRWFYGPVLDLIVAWPGITAIIWLAAASL